MSLAECKHSEPSIAARLVTRIRCGATEKSRAFPADLTGRVKREILKGDVRVDLRNLANPGQTGPCRRHGIRRLPAR